MFRQTYSREVGRQQDVQADMQLRGRQAAGCSGRHVSERLGKQQGIKEDTVYNSCEAFMLNSASGCRQSREKSRDKYSFRCIHSLTCVTFVTEFIFLLGLFRKKLLVSSATWDVSLRRVTSSLQQL